MALTSPIRPPVICFPPTNAYEHTENGTLFTGEADYYLSLIAGLKGIPIEYLTNLSQTITHGPGVTPAGQALLDGKADIMPTRHGMRSEFYDLMEYSGSLGTLPLKIISRKQQAVRGSVIEGIFDLTSYALIAGCLMLCILVMRLSYRHHGYQASSW